MIDNCGFITALRSSIFQYFMDRIIYQAAQLIQPANNFDEIAEFSRTFTQMIIEKSAQRKDLFPALYYSDSGIVYDVIAKTLKKYISLFVEQLGKFKKLKYSHQTTVEFFAGGTIHLLCNWLINIEKYDAKQFAEECISLNKQVFESNLFFE